MVLIQSQITLIPWNRLGCHGQRWHQTLKKLKPFNYKHSSSCLTHYNISTLQTLFSSAHMHKSWWIHSTPNHLARSVASEQECGVTNSTELCGMSMSRGVRFSLFPRNWCNDNCCDKFFLALKVIHKEFQHCGSVRAYLIIRRPLLFFFFCI